MNKREIKLTCAIPLSCQDYCTQQGTHGYDHQSSRGTDGFDSFVLFQTCYHHHYSIASEISLLVASSLCTKIFKIYSHNKFIRTKDICIAIILNKEQKTFFLILRLG